MIMDWCSHCCSSFSAHAIILSGMRRRSILGVIVGQHFEQKMSLIIRSSQYFTSREITTVSVLDKTPPLFRAACKERRFDTCEVTIVTSCDLHGVTSREMTIVNSQVTMSLLGLLTSYAARNKGDFNSCVGCPSFFLFSVGKKVQLLRIKSCFSK